ncbi:MAG: FHA domain-containing protein [Prevotellaceae bacterium]|jgi:hypothetical protein|nr:FHA domain-containing protein [Prevotellaceae bacterium]
MKIIKIGRSSSNDIVINDNQVSRTHCQIIKDDSGNYRLCDLNSANGTYVNGVRHSGEVRLNASDIVRIGNATLPWQSYFNNARGETEIEGRTVVDSGEYYPPTTHPQKGGGFGVAAFICGILGINLLAIVFGVIGWQRDRKNRGLAIAGFVLGCVWILLGIIYIMVIASAGYSAYYY